MSTVTLVIPDDFDKTDHGSYAAAWWTVRVPAGRYELTPVTLDGVAVDLDKAYYCQARIDAEILESWNGERVGKTHSLLVWPYAYECKDGRAALWDSVSMSYGGHYEIA